MNPKMVKVPKFRVMPDIGDYARLWIGKEMAVVQIIEYPTTMRQHYKCLVLWTNISYMKDGDSRLFSFPAGPNSYECGWLILAEEELQRVLTDVRRRKERKPKEAKPL